MQERIEPPILISRLMTFVMATSLVVLGVLVFTLDKMFPLNRPQVFFLTSQLVDDKELTLTKMPEDFDLEEYKKQFVREYVRERNEITSDLAIMRAKWANSPDGIIRTRSTDTVFGKFALTDMVNIVRQQLDEAFSVECFVEFPATHSVVRDTGAADTYYVSFTYDCRYGPLGDQKYVRPFKIRVELESNEQSSIKWADRMENPLGVRVSGYDVVNSQNKVLDEDPLNWTTEEE